MHRYIHIFSLFISLATLLCTAQVAVAVTPHDYYSSDYDPHLLKMVEKYHLKQAQEKMQSKGSLKWALGDVQFMLAYFPNHPVALHLATEIAQLMGNAKEADHFYARAVQLYPGTPQSWFLYGVQYQITGRLEDAVKMYRTAIKLDDKMAPAHYNLGIALVKLGKLDEARKEAERAEALGYRKTGLRKLLKAKGVR